jgi:F0F1-type ATP synthase membrane subunit b/b'
MNTLLWPFLNLIILIAVLLWKGKAPFTAFVFQRHSTIRDEVQRVRSLLRSAQVKYDEFAAKLKAVDAEINELNERAQQDAKAAQSRIIAEAQRLSAAVVTDARSSAELLYGELKGQLFLELGSRVIDKAEKLLLDRLTGDDRARIRQEFSSQVERVQ